MQPSSSTGRKARLALLPFSWLVALAVVAGVLQIVARIRGGSITQLLRTDTLWPLAIILPALLFGKVVGLISMNLIAYFSPLRRVFERECEGTSRHSFAAATAGLARFALGLFLLTVAGAVVFVLFGQ
jgi:hypothetical protein